MVNLALTRHAAERCAQRCIRPADLRLAMQIGTHLDDGVVVRKRDAKEFIAQQQAQIRRLKRQIKQAKRIVGLYLAQPADALVTAYRPSGGRRKRVLQTGYRRFRATEITAQPDAAVALDGPP